jgi:hypothetical protein
MLRGLVEDYPNFTEAKNRLATMLYLKGQTMESAVLCEVRSHEERSDELTV